MLLPKKQLKKHQLKERTTEAINNLKGLATTAVVTTARATAKAVTAGMKSIINKIKPTLPIPGLSSTNIENDSSKNANNNASLPIPVLSNFEATVTKYRDNASGRDKKSKANEADFGRLSPAAHALIGMTAIAAKTSLCS